MKLALNWRKLKMPNDLKIGVIGSCLSNLTVLQMCKDYNFTRIFNVAHNRSDAFVGNFVKKDWRQLPLFELSEILNIKPEHNEQGLQILNNQYEATCGTHELPSAPSIFTLSDNDVDVIVLDNFMDIAALLVKLDIEEVISPFFINKNFINITDDKLVYNDFLTPEESVENWLIIIDYLRSRFPSTRLVFLSFQYSTLIERKSHYHRAKAFDQLMSEKIKDKDVIFIPALTVKPILTKGLGDWAHFDNKIYKSLAGFIYLTLNSFMEVPLEQCFKKNIDLKLYNKELTMLDDRA
jgi:hypothetical protein